MTTKERDTILEAVGAIDDAIDLYWDDAPSWIDPKTADEPSHIRLLKEVREMLKRLTTGD